MSAWGKYEPLNLRYVFIMFETITITKIFMRFRGQKGIDAIILFYFPSLRWQSNLCKQKYVICKNYPWAYKSIIVHP